MSKRLFKVIKKKLRSEQGASLSMALLLFLVCAVVGSVILTAATASMGRISSKAEEEQQYYKLTSAAKVLADQLCGVDHAVAIETTVESKYPYTRDEGLDDEIEIIIDSTATDVAYKVKINDEPPITSNGNAILLPGGATFLEERAFTKMFGSTTISSGELSSILDKSFIGSPVSAVDISVNIGGETISGSCEMKADGSMVITLGGTDSSVVTIYMESVVDESSDYNEGDGFEETASDRYAVVTETKTSTIYWTLDGIQ